VTRNFYLLRIKKISALTRIASLFVSCLLIGACDNSKSDSNQALSSQSSDRPTPTQIQTTNSTTNSNEASTPRPGVSQTSLIPPNIALSSTSQLVVAQTNADQTNSVQSVDEQSQLAQYPPDIDGDDIPGIIVAGLNGISPSQLDSRLLAYATLLRHGPTPNQPGTGQISLVEYPQSYSVAAFLISFGSNLDSCLIQDPANSPLLAAANAPTTISGGAAISIDSPAGTWFAFSRLATQTGPTYLGVLQTPGPLPRGAKLSIPGDQFPALLGHPLYEPDPPTRLLPDADQEVTPDTTFSWLPSDRPTIMEISLHAFSDAFLYLGYAVTCMVVDDGSFSMPAHVRSFINGTDNRLLAFYTRWYQRLDLVNGVMVYQRVGVGG